MQLPARTSQYLFDDSLIASSQRLVRRWLPATIHPQPVLTPDRPWEGRALVLYGTLLPRGGGGWRMYYSNFVPRAIGSHASGRAVPSLMLAESDDGLTWHKPPLRVRPTDDGEPTNILHSPGTHLDSPSIAHDPDDSAMPYKMIGFRGLHMDRPWNETWGMYAMGSRDGLSWSPMSATDRPVLRAGDRSNLLVNKVDGQYLLYTRHPEMSRHVGTRAVYVSRSRDFLDWTEPQLVLAPDRADEPDTELYGMSVFFRNGWYFGLLEHWRGALDVIEVHLAISRDGINWQRPTRSPFIAATYPWNRSWSTCASNGPIEINEQLVFYFGGRFASHHWNSAQLDGVIGCASLAADRFCALESDAGGGHLITHPIEWPGGELTLNADTRGTYTSHPGHVHGQITVEVLDAEGRPMPLWSEDQKSIVRGNTHCRGGVHGGQARFAQDRSLDALRGRTIRLKIHFMQARLFTLAAT